ncbi:Gfo/Idh/MocA family oxidoreductase [Prosthecobacter sp.]|uniref:Gfo/Idh/MocA family protein n=1 Tax=Prosthecobacter sp. TaxID=1965333 RepID=UPI001D3F2AF2|nr:Gfo/Idh/MocA family oxidoreductase [Prosthecobacter sp.]MCB1278341.1 Gfo/Idh/MocA family oxidoreductase [Prosthecobacter sp.]
MQPTASPNRRQFLSTAVPFIVSAATLGRAGAVSPNGKVRLACIGVGGQGTSNLRNLMADERVQIVAVCDVDAEHAERAAKLAGLAKGDVYRDFREVLARSDVDAVMNATPDHWHSNVAIAAAKAGKDLYSEKPLGASIVEGRAICRAVAENKRVLQCGTWRRSGMKVRMACERVRNGYIGELKEIEIGVPGTFAVRGGYTGLEAAQEVPPHLDYAMWLGPAAEKPYTAARCHFNFRWIEEYAPGYITDWGAHFLDVAQWGAGMDDTTPVEVSATEVKRRPSGIYDAAEGFRIEYRYANGVRVVMLSTDDKTKWGTRFIGSEGWIFTESEVLKASSDDILRVKLKDSDVKLFESKQHHRNFIDAVLSRGRTTATAEIAQRAATTCHMGAISAALKRPLKFDPAAERFENDEQANQMLVRLMREAWRIV